MQPIHSGAFEAAPVLGWMSLSPALPVPCSLWSSKQHGILLPYSAPRNQHLLLRSVLASFHRLSQVVCPRWGGGA